VLAALGGVTWSQAIAGTTAPLDGQLVDVRHPQWWTRFGDVTALPADRQTPSRSLDVRSSFAGRFETDAMMRRREPTPISPTRAVFGAFS
jgi:hypothetical protein